VAVTVFFVVIDVLATLSGATWWPAHPGTLAWVMLGFQVAACSSLALRRRAPLAVVAILGAFTLAITLLIWPAGALTPAHEDNIWAPYSTILAAYGPVLCCRDRRTAFTAIGLLALVVARPWHATLLIISIGLVRTLVGPLLALYFEAEVLACLGEGLSNAQIARRLYLSEATIKGYVSAVMDKLGCANRTQAGLLAHDAGLVTGP
jgi:DNA-binding CsgD family transcriptional regulator